MVAECGAGLQDHYYNTVASDLLLLTYTHIPPGTVRKKRDIKQRLREWDDSSPYHKNRPLRGPRGGGPLRLLTEPRTFRNVPALTGVTLHTMVKEALSDSGHLAVAGMVLQAISGVRARIGFARKSVAPFSLRAGRAVSARVHLQGPLAYRFVASLVDVVMPRIKEYRGVKASSGDSSGNIALGFAPNHVILFPEIEGLPIPGGSSLRVQADWDSELRHVPAQDGSWHPRDAAHVGHERQGRPHVAAGLWRALPRQAARLTRMYVSVYHMRRMACIPFECYVSYRKNIEMAFSLRVHP